MIDDDRPMGRLLSRREAMILLGASGAGLLACGAQQSASPEGRPDCVVRPQQTAGPYFVDRRLERSDIRSDPNGGAVTPGVPLALTMMVSRLGGGSCEPLEGAMVDLWQCDARGVYSGVRDPQFNTIGRAFLRGYQLTDPAGAASFVTIYPGWYPGRTVHIHFRIRIGREGSPTQELTSQLYFEDALTDQVHASPPYAAKGTRRTRNAMDGIFRRGGSQLMLAPEKSGDGYAATFRLALQMD